MFKRKVDLEDQLNYERMRNIAIGDNLNRLVKDLEEKISRQGAEISHFKEVNEALNITIRNLHKIIIEDMKSKDYMIAKLHEKGEADV